ncbi:MAG TPA: glycoside hydrolase family 5 protein [Polyangiaceae bacterium]|nr:glycoside hydrolase family 5 protein [Polyangiaceae bacterium]
MHSQVSLSITMACLALGVAACSSPPGSTGGFTGSGSGTGTSGASTGSKSGSSGTTGTSGTQTGTSGSHTGSTGSTGSTGASTGTSGASGTTTGTSGTASGTSTTTSLAGPPDAPYTVNGAKIVGKSGQPHLFRGLDRPSLEFSCTGDIKSDEYEIMQEEWNANVVRLALNQDCWLDDPSNPTYSPNYAAIVDTQVQGAIAAGLDIILDLHWSDQGSYATGATCFASTAGCQQDMADEHSLTFWQQVAAKYGSNPNVLFELYNEPHVGGYMPQSADWTTWLSGGTSSGFTVVGMQQLYTAVRTAGATNLIVIGGLAWAYDLSGVPSHMVNGTNILYATHPYDTSTNPNPSGWTQYFGSLSATVPVIATEFGARAAGQPTSCSAGFDTSFIQYANGKASGSNPSNELSWTAWAFYFASSCTFPPLLADSQFTPNAPGMVVQSALMAGP